MRPVPLEAVPAGWAGFGGEPLVGRESTLRLRLPPESILIASPAPVKTRWLPPRMLAPVVTLVAAVLARPTTPAPLAFRVTPFTSLSVARVTTLPLVALRVEVLPPAL